MPSGAPQPPLAQDPRQPSQQVPAAAADDVGARQQEARPAKRPPTLASALSGGLSGALISACVQPLDVIRTKMQGDAALGITRSSFGTLAAIMKEGGVAGLWQGTQPSVLRVGLGAGLHFVLLEQMKAVLLAAQPAHNQEQLSAAGAALAGGLSRAVAAVLLCPITVVKTRMEYTGAASAVPRYRNTAHALVSIARHEGWRGLFQGLVPTVLTNAPFSGLYYMFYTQLKSQMSGEGRPQALVNFGSGVAASVAATLLTQPTDVLRTRLQLRLTDSGSLAALATILRQQGLPALMTGIGPRIVKRTTQTALVWTLYEELVPRVARAATWASMCLSPGPPSASHEASATAQQLCTEQEGDAPLSQEAARQVDSSLSKPALSAFVTPLTTTKPPR